MGQSPPSKNTAGFIHDLTDQELIDRFEEQCRPDIGRVKNKIDGFLGLDFYSDTGFIDATESLMEVVKRDHEYVVSKLGEEGHKIIIEVLRESIIKPALDKINTKDISDVSNVEVGNVLVRKIDYYGNQCCPFWSMGINDKNKPGKASCLGRGGVDYIITNKTTGEELFIPALILHLIEAHHFYEGNVLHRVDPEKLIRVLEIKTL